MSRICKAYETRFRWLLQQVRARQLDRGVRLLVDKARRLSRSQQLPLAHALTRTYESLCRKVRPPPTRFEGSVFFCDAGLGGLARWLRAAGYDALWVPGIDDDQLLREGRRLSATILTTDSMLMERRLLRDRVIPSYWLPPTLSIAEQLAAVFREFGLALRAPRCMACGGELRRESKEHLTTRIPPRTYRWLDAYYVCARCGKIFWHGTHWARIVGVLQLLPGPCAA